MRRWSIALCPILIWVGCSGSDSSVEGTSGVKPETPRVQEAGVSPQVPSLPWEPEPTPDSSIPSGPGKDSGTSELPDASLPDAETDPSDDAGGSVETDAQVSLDAGAEASVPDAALPDPILLLDAVQMRGTHNSYHLEPIIAFDGSHKYSHLALDRQLGEQGVRVLELDLHRANGDDSIDVYHITTIDARTTCLNFEDCLRTLKKWSEANDKHVPIIVWVEIKDDTGGPAFANLDKVDAVLRENLGDRLYTPDNLRGQAESVRDAIRSRGWPKINDLRGKILFVVLSQDADISAYSQNYANLSGKAMFVRVGRDQFDSNVAAFAKLGVDETDTIKAAHKAQLIIATNVCAINHNDDVCEKNRVSAIAQGIHLLKDDLPAKISGRNYYMALPEGKPVACNPLRAPQGCSAQALESL